MYCRANELRCKDVVSIKSGARIGYVCDFEIDLTTARVTALIVYGRYRCFGMLGRRKDIVIRWCDITLIGEDTILVTCDMPMPKRRRAK